MSDSKSFAAWLEKANDLITERQIFKEAAAKFDDVSKANIELIKQLKERDALYRQARNKIHQLKCEIEIIKLTNEQNTLLETLTNYNILVIDNNGKFLTNSAIGSQVKEVVKQHLTYTEDSTPFLSQDTMYDLEMLITHFLKKDGYKPSIIYDQESMTITVDIMDGRPKPRPKHDPKAFTEAHVGPVCSIPDPCGFSPHDPRQDPIATKVPPAINILFEIVNNGFDRQFVEIEDDEGMSVFVGIWQKAYTEADGKTYQKLRLVNYK